MFWPLTDAAGGDAGFLELLYDTEVSGTGKADSSVFDEKGPPGWVSLTWAEAPVPFDDVAVGAAVRACMRLRGVDFVSTLTTGDAAIIGAVLPRRILRYGHGLFGPAGLPAGSSTQRYGAATPWPNDRF